MTVHIGTMGRLIIAELALNWRRRLVVAFPTSIAVASTSSPGTPATEAEVR